MNHKVQSLINKILNDEFKKIKKYKLKKIRKNIITINNVL